MTQHNSQNAVNNTARVYICKDIGLSRKCGAVRVWSVVRINRINNKKCCKCSISCELTFVMKSSHEVRFCFSVSCLILVRFSLDIFCYFDFLFCLPPHVLHPALLLVSPLIPLPHLFLQLLLIVDLSCLLVQTRTYRTQLLMFLSSYCLSSVFTASTCGFFIQLKVYQYPYFEFSFRLNVEILL